MSGDKVRRLISAQQELLYLMKNNLDLETFNAIDETFYLQKVAELCIMLEQIDELGNRLRLFNERLTSEYTLVFRQWSRDARWLNRKLRAEYIK
jgi:hypothetical protein